jgi:L-alanine-DL-glutamate epimerase-like enolase superfamily enzyme
LIISIERIETEDAPFRTPFKFGAAVISALRVPHVRLRMELGGKTATGYGAMPLGNAWSYPGIPYEESLVAMEELTARLAKRFDNASAPDDIMEASRTLRMEALRTAAELASEWSERLTAPIPELCALVTFSPFDIALFDAWGRLNVRNTFDLLRERYPEYALALSPFPTETLNVFHAVGGVDALTPGEVAKSSGDDLPDDLQTWMARENLTHFKIKLQGKDPEWDYQRVAAVDRTVSQRNGSEDPSRIVFSLDANEQCPSGEALNELLMRLKRDEPRAFSRIAFVEQPSPRNPDSTWLNALNAAAALKPCAIDEGLTSAEALEQALSAGYNGICLKACKGIGFSVEMAAEARRRNLYVCVQDLTCPGISLLASASLASRTGVSGLEANARQFCPAANTAAAKTHPEVFAITKGKMSTGRLDGIGLGYAAPKKG